jgi:glycosyltransferase involved in cell wall biosynthesis
LWLVQKSRWIALKSKDAKRMLVLSYSNFSKDSRVLRQILWLKDAGYAVDGVGFGVEPQNLETFYRITPPALWIRLLIYVFAPARLRSSILLKSIVTADLMQHIQNGKYEGMVLNDLDFLALDQVFDSASFSKTKVFLDLHEFFPDVGGSLIYRGLHGRYHKFLQSLIHSRNISGFITVSTDIAIRYEEIFQRKFVSVENIPNAKRDSNQNPQMESWTKSTKDSKTQVVYHGNPGKGRGVYRLILAMKWVPATVALNLMLTGPKYKIFLLRSFSALVGSGDKITFWPAVAPHSVTSFLAKFDLAIIFFPPPHTTSINLSLPNKFFEALTSGMGVIVGPNPTMGRIVKQYDCGLVLSNWGIRNLARELSTELDRESVVKWRANSKLVVNEFSVEKAQEKFLSAILR